MRTTITFAFYAISTSAILVSAAPINTGNSIMIRDGGSAYTGAGGSSIGGSLSENNSAQGNSGIAGGDDVLGIASGNAGDGGKATSGNAIGGVGSQTVSYVNGQPVITTSNGGSAYSGVGGNTNGGNINQNNNAGPYYSNGNWYYYDNANAAGNLDALNVASGNAGDGGDSSSGNAIGGSATPLGAYGYPYNNQYY
ncbi:uncharacterized protein I206_103332 [Kwoniella pini CBS 10737]|uniref:Uncharacterized protein n=1 Tax=Kwoniella pini CBS 10737 TaxID=1296096 RepID=A0A1B9IA70_9TREE|nr:uncharacterized protein I206_01662 [Kwoniella pini CBS 10737]OCF52373.1 hypothetical protein I206_01662 [Kwoniella pini CBS 10737]